MAYINICDQREVKMYILKNVHFKDVHFKKFR